MTVGVKESEQPGWKVVGLLLSYMCVCFCLPMEKSLSLG